MNFNNEIRSETIFKPEIAEITSQLRIPLRSFSVLTFEAYATFRSSCPGIICRENAFNYMHYVIIFLIYSCQFLNSHTDIHLHPTFKKKLEIGRFPLNPKTHFHLKKFLILFINNFLMFIDPLDCT